MSIPMINKAKLSATWFLSIVVGMVLFGCSKQSEPQVANVKSLPDSFAKSAGNIMEERAHELGIEIGYDAKNHRYANIISLYHKQGESAPEKFKAVINFLNEVGILIGSKYSLNKPLAESSAETFEIKVDEKNFFGMDSFLYISRLKRKVMSAEAEQDDLDTEISVVVADEKATYSSSKKAEKWTISPAAAALIVKRFESAGGKIVDEASVTVKNGSRAGLVDKAWLITIPIEKPPQKTLQNK
jgi:hypothetical protein